MSGEPRYARSRYRFHRPHADRQGLSRRVQRHPGPGTRRPRHTPCRRARRRRSGGSRRCDHGRRLAAGFHRRQHGAPERGPRRSAEHGRRHVGRPAMFLGHDGNRDGGQGDRPRRYDGHGRRRAGEHLAGPERGHEHEPGVRSVDRRPAAGALHDDAGDRRGRRGTLRRVAREAGRICRREPSADRRGAAGRPAGRRDRAPALDHEVQGQGNRRGFGARRRAGKGRGQPAGHDLRSHRRFAAGVQERPGDRGGQVHYRRQCFPAFRRRVGRRADGSVRSLEARPWNRSASIAAWPSPVAIRTKWASARSSPCPSCWSATA